jgi:type VI protein secretion system component VasK
MKTEQVASPEFQEVQKALSQIQAELYNHRGVSERSQKRIERRLTDIVWFIIIFFVLDVVAQRVMGL